MLKFLNIANLTVIHRLNFELHQGLCLLTGETGAGKSIIVDALGLLLGRRASSDLVRTGERTALIEGVFELGEAARRKIRQILGGAGICFEGDDDLIIRRELQPGGRSRIFVNDHSVTASTLRLLQPLLVEIQGQGEQYALAAAHSHLEMLDGFAGCVELRARTAQSYRRWKEAEAALRQLRQKKSEQERLADYLEFQISEIEKVNPQEGEDARLNAEKALLVHAERALELCETSYAELYEHDRSLLTQLGAVRRRAQELAAIDARVGHWSEMIEQASVLLSEVAEEIRGFGARIDFSPQRLGDIEDRLAALEKLKRKYGKEIEEVVGLREELKTQVEALKEEVGREGELEQEASAAKGAYLSLAEELSAVRHAAAPALEKRVSAELKHLALGRSIFIVSVETVSRSAENSGKNAASGQGAETVSGGGDISADVDAYSQDGADRVEFLFSANEGESPRPLAKVASGGELSRLMLAIRTVCLGAQDAGRVRQEPSLVFDEIDAGIGGRTAGAVGLRLKELAKEQQVLCVTHQAQIARFADHHYAVSKRVERGRTVTSVRELGAEEKVEELARMIGGSLEVEAVRETARWMLEGDAPRRASGRGAKQAGARGKT